MLLGQNGRAITKPPLLQESRLTGGGSPNLVVLVEWKVAVEVFMGAANSFGCYSSNFTLSRAFLSTRTQTLGEPPHTSFAIEVGFGANGND